MPDLRRTERDSIRSFVKQCANLGMFVGNVLDWGCGKQPYRRIIESAGGTYFGWDKTSFPGSVVTEDVGDLTPFEMLGENEEFDAILMTQVWQYMEHRVLREILNDLGWAQGTLKPGGWLVVTGPTNWPVVEKEDLFRFTPAGVEKLLENNGFSHIDVNPRASVTHNGEEWILGWKATARS